MHTPDSIYTRFKHALITAPKGVNCHPFSPKYDVNDVIGVMKSIAENGKVSKYVAEHMKVARGLNVNYQNYYKLMDKLFAESGCDALELEEFVVAMANLSYLNVRNLSLAAMDNIAKESCNFVDLTTIQIDTSDGEKIHAKEHMEAVIDGVGFVLRYLRYFEKKEFEEASVHPRAFTVILDMILQNSSIMSVLKGAHDSVLYCNGYIKDTGHSILFDKLDYQHEKLVYAGQLMLQNRFAEVLSKWENKVSRFDKYWKDTRIDSVTIADGECTVNLAKGKSKEILLRSKFMDAAIVSNYEFLQDITLPKAGNIMIEEVLAVWNVLVYITVSMDVSFDPKAYIYTKKDMGFVPRKFKKTHLIDSICKLCTIEREKIETALSLFCNDRNKYSYIWSSPLIEVRDFVVFVAHAIPNAQLYNLIDSIIERGGISLDVRGKMFEQYLHKEINNCNKMGHSVLMPSQQKFKGEEIDVLISLKNLVIVADAKCIRHPMEPVNDHDAWKTLSHGAEQARKKMKYVIEHPDEFIPLIGDYSKKKIIPIVVTNYPNYTACDADGAFIIDSHSLIAYLRTGSYGLRLMNSNNPVTQSFYYHNEDEMSANFSDYIRHNPIKEMYLEHISMHEYPLTLSKEYPAMAIGPVYASSAECTERNDRNQKEE